MGPLYLKFGQVARSVRPCVWGEAANGGIISSSWHLGTLRHKKNTTSENAPEEASRQLHARSLAAFGSEGLVRAGPHCLLQE